MAAPKYYTSRLDPGLKIGPKQKLGYTAGKGYYAKSPALPPKQPKSTLTGVRTMNQLQNIATTQTDAELSSQIDPLQHEVGTTQSREAAAQAELEHIFGDLQPQINDISHLVSDNFDKTMAAEQAIFSAAGQRLNTLKQDAASEAQKVAQQVGGPVAVDKFTGAVDPSIAAYGAEAAGGLLHAMGTGLAGVQSQADWAGKVFPLIRTDREMGVRQGYEDQISKLQSDIATLKGTRTGKINDRLNTLLTQEREYQMNQVKQKLDQRQFNLQRQSTLHTLKNDDKRLALAQGQFGLTKKSTLAGISQRQQEIYLKNLQLTQTQKLAAQKLGLSESQFKRKLAVDWAKVGVQQQRVRVQQQKNAFQIAQAAANPKSIKPITVTEKAYIAPGSPRAALAGAGKISGVAYDYKKKMYYQYIKHTMMPSAWVAQNLNGQGINDPDAMYKMLRGMGNSPALSRQATYNALHKYPTKKK